MQFLVDTVSDYSFFGNMLLGIANSLYKYRGITRTFVKKSLPLTHAEIGEWEQTQGVTLPIDLRTFYLSCNGFSFEWNLVLSNDALEERVKGGIYLNALEEVLQVYGYETTNDSGLKYVNNRYEIRLSPESKIFELTLLPERGKVVLVYLYPKYRPTIWLLTTAMTFHFLADDVASYLRMATAHLGIPNWQFEYAPEGVPAWSENIFRLMAPHLLPLNGVLERKSILRKYRNDLDYPDFPVNELDPALFECLSNAENSEQASSPTQSVPDVGTTKVVAKPVMKPAQHRFSRKLINVIKQL